jgi:hypothetical protein
MLDASVYKDTLKSSIIESARTRAAFLKETGIFRCWTEEQLSTLGVLSEQVEFRANQTIVREGMHHKYTMH